MSPYKPNTEGPDEDDPICLASYVIAGTLVNGSPRDTRGFWPAYWEALAVNEKTEYNNNRVKICAPIIREILLRNPNIDDEPIYYRSGKLIRDDNREVRDVV